MALSTYLISTVLTGLLLLLIVAAYLRAFAGRSYVFEPPSAEEDGLDRLEAWADSPTAWMTGFLLLVLVFGVAPVLYVGGFGIGDGAARAAGVAMAAAFALLLSLLAFVGAYDAARSRGRPSSFAAAEGLGLLGLLFVVVIAAKLVVGA